MRAILVIAILITSCAAPPPSGAVDPVLAEPLLPPGVVIEALPDTPGPPSRTTPFDPSRLAALEPLSAPQESPAPLSISVAEPEPAIEIPPEAAPASLIPQTALSVPAPRPADVQPVSIATRPVPAALPIVTAVPLSPGLDPVPKAAPTSLIPRSITAAPEPDRTEVQPVVVAHGPLTDPLPPRLNPSPEIATPRLILQPAPPAPSALALTPIARAPQPVPTPPIRVLADRPAAIPDAYPVRPLTWGAACRLGDASACIMAQAEGPNRGP